MTASFPSLTRQRFEELAASAFEVPNDHRPPDGGTVGVGLELEWIVLAAAAPARPVPAAETLEAFGGPLQSGGILTAEPGGQLELSTPRSADVWSALRAAERDEEVLRRRGRRHGLLLLSTGVDPLRAPVRSLTTPRYRLMEDAFNEEGTSGRFMMCATASLQVNVDFGRDPFGRWRKAALVAPLLAAAFAHSPFRAGRRSPFASTRAAIWAHVDPSRTTAVPTRSLVDWYDYVLSARALFARRPGRLLPLPRLSFGEWLSDGHAVGFPDAGDLAEHLTTLFPPLRPRGYLECRMFDALTAADRMVAVSALVGLLDDDVDLATLSAGCERPAEVWSWAASGLSSPARRGAARRCLSLAAQVLEDRSPPASSAVRAWLDAKGRRLTSPAATACASWSCDRHPPCPRRLLEVADHDELGAA